jgi:hypothetical protein
MENQKFIVRGKDSGVFYGSIKSRVGSEVEMTNARCLWRWCGAFSLNEMALIGTTKPEDCKFTAYVDGLTITDAVEILLCTYEAISSIEGVLPWSRR